MENRDTIIDILLDMLALTRCCIKTDENDLFAEEIKQRLLRIKNMVYEAEHIADGNYCRYDPKTDTFRRVEG